MSRRVITPYLIAGATGIVSGVYIFRPLLQEAVAQQKAQEELRATTQSESAVSESQFQETAIPPANPATKIK